jgi:hypothetical protein
MNEWMGELYNVAVIPFAKEEIETGTRKYSARNRQKHAPLVQLSIDTRDYRYNSNRKLLAAM